MGEIQAPSQYPDEPAKAYAYFTAWCGSVPVDATSEQAAKILGLTEAYVRRLWKKWDWHHRRSPLEQATNDAITTATVEKKAATIADKAAEAWMQATYARQFLAAELGNKAVRAMRALEIEQLDATGVIRLAGVAMKELAPRATAVSVSTDGKGAINVEIAALEGLPPAVQAAKAKQIADEAARKASLLADYYDNHATDE